MHSETTKPGSFLRCQVAFISDLTLDAIAERLLFPLQASGLTRTACEEIPSIRLDFVGLQVTLQGFGGNDGYLLSIYPRPGLVSAEAEIVDLSSFFKEVVTQSLKGQCSFQ